jgi:hypothetical protein
MGVQVIDTHRKEHDMKVPISKKGIAAVAAAAVVGVGGSAAIAANTFGSPSEQSAAVIDDAASQLGVDAASLSAALKQALNNRVDAALAAGTITEEQAAEMKERIASEDYPIVGFGGPGGGHHGHRGHVSLDAAAAYLGVTQDELRASLEEGDTLADVAKAEGKSEAGLVDAIVAAEKKRLAADVESGRITDAQRDEMVAALPERVADMVNRTRTPRPHAPSDAAGDAA